MNASLFVVILLRSVVIATCAYLVFSGESAVGIAPFLYVAVFAASNVALAFAPRALFYRPHFGPALLLSDTAVILFGMSWSHGLSQDLLLAYHDVSDGGVLATLAEMAFASHCGLSVGLPQGPGGLAGRLFAEELGAVLQVRAGSRPVRVIVVAGRPLREPVMRHGPFVMNTRQELMQAFVDFQEGRF